jgi:hypothetical protein
MMNYKNLLKAIPLIGIVGVAIYFTFASETTMSPTTGDASATEKTTITVAANESPSTEVNTAGKNLPKVTKADCFALFNNNQTAELLRQQQNQLLISTLRELQLKGYDQTQLDTVGDVAGLNQNEVFAALQGHDIAEQNDIYDEVLLPDNYENQINMPSEARRQFDKLLDKKDYAGMANAFNSQAINPRQVNIGRSLLALIIANDPKISVSEVQSLLNAGTEIHLEAIAAAVKSSSNEVVTLLAEKYPGKLDTIWQVNSMNTNLAMASGSVFRDDLFFYFLGKGVHAYADNGFESSTLFDVMPAPKTDTQKQRALIYVSEALKYKLPINNYSSLERLKSWLPLDVQQTFQDSLITSEPISAELIERGKNLQFETQQFPAKIAQAKATEQACEKQLGYTTESYLKEFLEANPNSATLSLATKKLLSKHIGLQVKGQWSELAKKAMQAVDPVKVRHIEETTTAYQAIQGKAFDKQWDEGLALCSNYPNANLRSDLCSQLLNSYAHEENATWEFIEKLLPHVDQLSPYLISGLSIRNRLDLIQKLIPYGLQLDYQTHDGNVLHTLAQFDRTSESLKFLLDQGVATKSAFLGVDVLDTALARLDHFNSTLKTPNGAPYFTGPQDIALLLNAGAPIERSHIEKIQQLKTLNPDAYQALIAAAPNLSAY